MKATSDKSHPHANIGDNGKGKGDLRNIFGVLLQKNNEGYYKGGTKHSAFQKLYC
ncbi:hypothetical protein KGM_208632A, partial [Danaus plexippus plexippus]